MAQPESGIELREQGIPLVDRGCGHLTRVAVDAAEGSFTYGDLLTYSARAAAALLTAAAPSTRDLGEAPVAFLVPPSFAYVATLWGIFRAGGLAVPHCVSHPTPELEHVLDDTGSRLLVAHPDLASRLQPLAEARGVPLLSTTQLLASSLPLELPTLDPRRRALIVYTSGTTSRPKGAVLTHANLAAQIESLVEAWEWSADDRILHVLPLHHVHGIVNVLCCALWSGAACEILPSFDARTVWERVAGGTFTLFMAVPTIYQRLIRAWEEASEAEQRSWSAACRKLRLWVSGSAALPVSVLDRFRELSGQTLLERYGMTEIGMALSNPLHGERRPGSVGRPLPGVELRLVDERGELVPEGVPGEIEVRGAGVFLEYWGRPQVSRRAFRDGWFRTGDSAVLEDGAYRILGRQSVDILKSGGYKVSALEIEEVLRTHGAIQECAVVGVPDPEWGERVAAVVVLTAGSQLSLEELRQWGRERLAPYKVPSLLKLVEALPRNALGKITKPPLSALFRS